MVSGIIILFFRVLLAICLYGFIGWALFTIWRQLQSTGKTLLNRKAPLLTLSMEDHPTRSREFSTAEVIIGRDTNCEFSLPDDETISSHHSRLSFHHGQWWLEDMNSTNGTFLNDEIVTTPTVIITGDEIRVGTLKIHISIKKD